jgi:LacI family transcriptional regulator
MLRRLKPTSESLPARTTPTLAQIAAAARVSKATVSRALRGHPALASATVQRVRRAARALGYAGSPLVGEVMRRIRRGAHFQSIGQIAYLTLDPTADGWRQHITFVRFFEGASARAEKFGLRVEPFWIHEPGLTARRATAILEARGVEGVLVGPGTGWTRNPELDWRRFSAVKIGTPFAGLPLPCAVHNHFQGATCLLTELARRGYRRPGLVLRDYQDTKTGGAWSAPLFRAQQNFPAADRVPPLLLGELALPRFAAWLDRHEPDVVVGVGNYLPEWLARLGRRVPRDIGFADLDRCTPDRAGIEQRSDLIGGAAVDLLLSRLLTRERGLSPCPPIVTLEGEWLDGPSLRRLPRSR